METGRRLYYVVLLEFVFFHDYYCLSTGIGALAAGMELVCIYVKSVIGQTISDKRPPNQYPKLLILLWLYQNITTGIAI